MICKQRADLLAIHYDAVQRYSKAVKDLSENIGICAQHQYQQFCQRSEQARIRAQEAQQAIDKHIAACGCMFDQEGKK